MTKATIALNRVTINGRTGIEIVIRNGAQAGIADLLDSLGIVPTADIANRRSKVCYTAEELDAARNPLKGLVIAEVR